MFLVCLCVCLPNVSKLGYNYLKYSFCGQNPDTIFCFRKDATAAVGVWVTSACSPFEPFAPSKIAKTVNKTRNRNYTKFFFTWSTPREPRRFSDTFSCYLRLSDIFIHAIPMHISGVCTKKHTLSKGKSLPRRFYCFHYVVCVCIAKCVRTYR